MNKKGLIGSLIVVGVLLVVGIFWFVGEKDSVSPEVVCFEDSDCVKVQVGCCGCNMGGEERCVNRDFESVYLDILNNCSEFAICAAVDRCEIKSCGCSKGVCVGR